MAGFGRRLIAGLAAGGANYFGAKYKEQEEDRKSAALLLREKALAEFRSTLTKDEATHRGTVEARTYRENKTADVDAKTALIPVEAEAEIKVATGKERAAYERWKLQFPAEERAKLTLERFRQDRADSRQDDEQQHDLDTNPIITTENLAGESTAVFGEGARNRTLTARGSRHRAPPSEETDPLNLGEPKPPPARTTRIPAAAPETGARERAMTKLISAYSAATPESHPGLFRNGRKISMEEARQIIEEAYGE